MMIISEASGCWPVHTLQIGLTCDYKQDPKQKAGFDMRL
jgi:hypothetical protein